MSNRLFKLLMLVCCSAVFGGWSGGCFSSGQPDFFSFEYNDTFAFEDDISCDVLVPSMHLDAVVEHHLLDPNLFARTINHIVINGRPIVVMPATTMPLRAPPVVG